MSSITIPRDEYCALLIGQTQCPCLHSWMAQSASFMDSLLLDMEVLVIGDLNSDALPGSSCPEGQALMDLCIQLFRENGLSAKNVHATIPKGNMGYDQYTVPDSVAVESTFVAFL